MKENSFKRICPKCLSKDVSPDLSAEAYGKGSIFNAYKCNKCGFRGIFFPEVTEEELKRLLKKSRESKTFK